MTLCENLEFRSMLVKISDGISTDELESMKFLCSDYISKKNREEITRPLNLWDRLIELGKLDNKNFGELKRLLEKRIDLLRLVTAYEHRDTVPPSREVTEGSTPRAQAIPEDLKRAFKIITDNIEVRKWRGLARSLGLTDTEIDGVVEKHRGDVKEQIRLALRTWADNSMADGSVKPSLTRLIAALKDCEMNRTINLIQNPH